MDKGWILKVTEVGAVIRLGTTAYQGVTEPNHRCQDPKPLQADDPVDGKECDTDEFVGNRPLWL